MLSHGNHAPCNPKRGTDASLILRVVSTCLPICSVCTICPSARLGLDLHYMALSPLLLLRAITVCEPGRLGKRLTYSTSPTNDGVFYPTLPKNTYSVYISRVQHDTLDKERWTDRSGVRRGGRSGVRV